MKKRFLPILIVFLSFFGCMKMVGILSTIELFSDDKINNDQILIEKKTIKPQESENELKILQNLRKRRIEIDEKLKLLTIKEAALDSLQKEVDKKLALLEKERALVKPIDDANVIKLVKVYESMKPEEAAKIFNDLDIKVIVKIARQMKENKLALIVSDMEPGKAKELTLELVSKVQYE